MQSRPVTGIIIQARMASERLPGKILRPLAAGGFPMLVWVVERCRQVKKADRVIVATTKNPSDEQVVDLCQKRGYPYFRGSEEDVLGRYVSCLEAYALNTVVRVTADCPFISPEIIERSIDLFRRERYDYVNNTRFKKSFPRGLDVEVLSQEVLRKISQLATRDTDKEHVTLYIYRNPQEFSIGTLEADPPYHAPELRLTVDTEEDFELASEIARAFQKEGVLVDTRKVIEFLKNHLEIAAINSRVQQKPIDGEII